MDQSFKKTRELKEAAERNGQEEEEWIGKKKNTTVTSFYGMKYRRHNI